MRTTDPYAVVADNPQFATVLSPTPTQSIPDLIWFLKSCYSDSDFDRIQQLLLSRENTFAQSNKELSNRIVDLELRLRSAVEELQRAEEERKRWKRECEAEREEKAKVETELEAMKGLMNEKVSRMMKEVKALMVVAYTRVVENGHSGGKKVQDSGKESSAPWGDATAKESSGAWGNTTAKESSGGWGNVTTNEAGREGLTVPEGTVPCRLKHGLTMLCQPKHGLTMPCRPKHALNHLVPGWACASPAGNTISSSIGWSSKANSSQSDSQHDGSSWKNHNKPAKAWDSSSGQQSQRNSTWGKTIDGAGNNTSEEWTSLGDSRQPESAMTSWKPNSDSGMNWESAKLDKAASIPGWAFSMTGDESKKESKSPWGKKRSREEDADYTPGLGSSMANDTDIESPVSSGDTAPGWGSSVAGGETNKESESPWGKKRMHVDVADAILLLLKKKKCGSLYRNTQNSPGWNRDQGDQVRNTPSSPGFGREPGDQDKN